MKLSYAYKDISQLTLGIIGVFCCLSLLLVGGYLYVGYQSYLSTYKITQQAELQSAQDKINSNVDNIKKLYSLTAKRIVASNGDTKRIQNILVSTYSLLPDRDFLKIQKVTYEKLSHPQGLISRLGVISLEPNKHSIDRSSKSSPSIFFDQNSVYSKTWILDQKGQSEGILEIHVPLPHFKETLNLGASLSFVPDSTHVLLQKYPLSIYGKLPEPFWGYFSKSIGHYTIFFLFIVFAAIFILLSNIYSHFDIKGSFKEEIESLRKTVTAWQEDSHKANDALLTSRKREETHHVTCQSYKQFQTSFWRHQKEQLHHVLRSLDVIMRSFQNPNASLSSQELIDILKSCLNVVERIVNGSLSPSKKGPIKVIKILSNIRSLFTEKLYKSDLTMELNCPENLTYAGDPLILEFVLLNLIGQPLYMLPKNGKIEIKVTDKKEGFSIQVKHNGFPANNNSQKQLQQTFAFFTAENQFQQLCRDNNFFYEHNKDKDDLNRATIFFPNIELESSSTNVVHLFNK